MLPYVYITYPRLCDIMCPNETEFISEWVMNGPQESSETFCSLVCSAAAGDDGGSNMTKDCGIVDMFLLNRAQGRIAP